MEGSDGVVRLSLGWVSLCLALPRESRSAILAGAVGPLVNSPTAPHPSCLCSVPPSKLNRLELLCSTISAWFLKRNTSATVRV